jgi:hypothetical protein
MMKADYIETGNCDYGVYVTFVFLQMSCVELVGCHMREGQYGGQIRWS